MTLTSGVINNDPTAVQAVQRRNNTNNTNTTPQYVSSVAMSVLNTNTNTATAATTSTTMNNPSLGNCQQLASSATEQYNAKVRAGWSEQEAKEYVKTSNHNNNSNSSSTPTVNLYADEKAQSLWRWRYYRYINPCVRFLLILPILYLYTVSSAALTYRGNSWQRDVDEILRDPNTWPSSSRPLPGNEERGWFILRDLGFDIFPSQGGSAYDSWKYFADFSPAFWNVVLLILLLVRRDIIRLTEYLAYQMLLFSVNAVAHVVTSLPDAGGIQDSCYDETYYKWGSWAAHMITFVYCNDMLWSGHTANTLLPMIMIRRLVWDLVGWNYTYTKQPTDSETKEQRARREASKLRYNEATRIKWAIQLANSYNAQHDKNNAFQQFLFHSTSRANEHLLSAHCDDNCNIINPAHSTMQYNNTSNQRLAGIVHSTKPNPNDRAEFKYDNDTDSNTVKFHSEDTHAIQVQEQQQHNNNAIPANAPTTHNASSNNNSAYCNVLNNEAAAEMLSMELNPATIGDEDRNDQRITVTLPDTNDPSVLAENNDEDYYFHVKKSPFVTPVFVARHRLIFSIIITLTRIIIPIWFALLCISIILIRYHYTVDIIIAIAMVLLVATNTQMFHWSVRWLYRPYYHNYQYRQWWKPVYLTWPLNQEQINFEERLRRVGVGGALF